MTGLPVMETARSGGGRQRAVTAAVVAAVLLAVVDVLTALDDYDDFNNARRRHRIRHADTDDKELSDLSLIHI